MMEQTAALEKRKRPVALTVIGIIGIIYSASGLAGAVQAAVFAPLMTVFGHFMNGIAGSYGGFPDHFFSDLYGGFIPWMYLLAGIGLPVFLFGLIVNIGALKNKPWTRTGMIVFALLLFLEAAVTAVAMFGMMIPFLGNMEAILGQTPMSALWSVYSIFLKLMMVLSPILSCVFPTVMLLIINKQAVKDHYRRLQG